MLPRLLSYIVEWGKLLSRKFLLLFLVKVHENLDFYEFYKEHAKLFRLVVVVPCEVWHSLQYSSQGYIICILQHFAMTLWNITNFVMLFQAVIKFLGLLRSKF